MLLLLQFQDELDVLIRAVQSQSPIHRECFCYGKSRNSTLPCKRQKSQSPIHRKCFCYSGINSHQTVLFLLKSRNPLFIGNAFATPFPQRLVAGEAGSVAIPYSSGMLLLPRSRSTARSGMSVWSQSPIHRECFCYMVIVAIFLAGVAASRNPLFIGNAFATVGTTRCMGRVCFLLCRNPLFIGNAFATIEGAVRLLRHALVAIPYSSGMLLLLRVAYFITVDYVGRGRNPLFIGNAFATCVGCLAGRRYAYGIRRNPLFIGNAFATASPNYTIAANQVFTSQSPIHRECFCYVGMLACGVCRDSVGSQSPIHRECFCYSHRRWCEGIV